MIAGSALGMVNYKGFIPWDDDIDICVMREDWPKFIEALNKDLDKKFYFQCFENDKRFNVINGPTMKIRKRGTYIEEVNFLLKNRCKSGNGIFIDAIIYDNISDSKLSFELNSLVIKLLMPLYILIDNLHIPHVLFSKFIRWYAEKYARRHENSKLVSQPITVPWEKFLHEPVFLKEDVFPFKKYEFEGRKFYSYNNIEKVLKQWYGPNCLKRWNKDHWEEPYPVEKRKPKHTAYINLHGESKER
jgi:lipopolysaccharide cholinephosphotransferase